MFVFILIVFIIFSIQIVVLLSKYLLIIVCIFLDLLLCFYLFPSVCASCELLLRGINKGTSHKQMFYRLGQF